MIPSHSPSAVSRYQGHTTVVSFFPLGRHIAPAGDRTASGMGPVDLTDNPLFALLVHVMLLHGLPVVVMVYSKSLLLKKLRTGRGLMKRSASLRPRVTCCLNSDDCAKLMHQCQRPGGRSLDLDPTRARPLLISGRDHTSTDPRLMHRLRSRGAVRSTRQPPLGSLGPTANSAAQ